MAYNIDRLRGKVSDIRQNIENKRGEVSQLEKQKQELLDAGTKVQDSDIDESVQRTLMDQINQALEDNSEKAEELSDQMNADVSDIEEMKQETQDSMESNRVQRASIEQKKSLLDRFGIGSSLDSALSELDDNQVDLEEFMDSLIETGKELYDLAHRFSSI